MIPPQLSEAAEITGSGRSRTGVVSEIVEYGTACRALQDPGGLCDALSRTRRQTLPTMNNRKKNRGSIKNSTSKQTRRGTILCRSGEAVNFKSNKVLFKQL
jgi:hypothetical protein